MKFSIAWSLGSLLLLLTGCITRDAFMPDTRHGDGLDAVFGFKRPAPITLGELLPRFQNRR